MSDYATAMKIIKDRQKTLPVPVSKIAYDLGLKVFIAKGWNKNQSGMIKKVGNNGYHIYVNGAHPTTRQRFTLAHELAHWILHRDLIGDGITEDALYRSGLSVEVEIEANKMAADILMPRTKVDQLRRDSDLDVKAIAEIFNVSEQAMAIRLGVPN